MNSKTLVLLVLVSLMAIQINSVEGYCFRYVCRRRCRYRPPRFEEYAFRWIWPLACGRFAVRFWGFKACCVTFGRY